MKHKDTEEKYINFKATSKKQKCRVIIKYQVYKIILLC